MSNLKKIKVIRNPKRGFYDKETIHSILDKSFLCHVGFIHENYPVVIPTLFGRKDDTIFLHGSSASRMMNNLEKGIEVCVTVTIVNGIVLARSAYHHSMNYESVVIFGKAELVKEENKLTALKIISDQVLRNRWQEVRMPNKIEMKATKVLEIKMDNVSAKIRTGPPIDDTEDYELNVWAGILPIETNFGQPIPDPLLKENIKFSIDLKNNV